MSLSPPILEYDDLPAHSGIVFDRTPDGIEILVPAEDFRSLMQRSLRMPRFWISLVAIWLSQSWFFLWQAYQRGTLMLGGGWHPMLGIQGVCLFPGMMLGIYIVGRRRATLRVVRTLLMLETRGMFSSFKREWEASRVLEIRSNGIAVLMKVARQPDSRLKKPQRIALLAGRHPAELEWVARNLREAMKLSHLEPSGQPVL